MSMVINSNIMSLNAQRQLSTSQGEMKMAMERLASGKRINSAKDDAAGLAIANRMTSDIRGINQAIRNANDGISLIQTAEGALQETTNILQRMRELSIQSANGTYDTGNRNTLNAEVVQLKAEVDRIANTTTFNGQKLLDGSLGEIALQVGSQANQLIAIEIGKLDAKGLGGQAAGDITGRAMADNVTSLQEINGTGAIMKINNQSVGDLSGETTLAGILKEMNKNVSGVEITAFTELAAEQTGNGIIRGTDTLRIELIGPDQENFQLDIVDTGSMQEVVNKINSLGSGLMQASLDDAGKLVLSNTTGARIQVDLVNGTNGASLGGAALEAAVGFASGNTAANAQLAFTITDPSIKDITITYEGAGMTNNIKNDIGVQTRTEAGVITGQTVANGALREGDIRINGVNVGKVDDGTDPSGQVTNLVTAINEVSAQTGVVATATAGDGIQLRSVNGSEFKIELGGGGTAKADVEARTGLIETNNASSVGNAVANIDISTAAGAQRAIGILDQALEQVNAIRGDLGAINNRLDFTINNLSNVSENLAASRSRIEDADFAAESAALSRAQVLQQAGTAMLAQANAQPQQVLSLLQ